MGRNTEYFDERNHWCNISWNGSGLSHRRRCMAQHCYQLSWYIESRNNEHDKSLTSMLLDGWFTCRYWLITLLFWPDSCLTCTVQVISTWWIYFPVLCTVISWMHILGCVGCRWGSSIEERRLATVQNVEGLRNKPQITYHWYTTSELSQRIMVFAAFHYAREVSDMTQSRPLEILSKTWRRLTNPFAAFGTVESVKIC